MQAFFNTTALVAHTYVGYDPINHVDPDGRRAFKVKWRLSEEANASMGLAYKKVLCSDATFVASKPVKSGYRFVAAGGTLTHTKCPGADGPYSLTSKISICLRGYDAQTPEQQIGCDRKTFTGGIGTVRLKVDTADGLDYHYARCGYSKPKAYYYVSAALNAEIKSGIDKRVRFKRSKAFNCTDVPMWDKATLP